MLPPTTCRRPLPPSARWFEALERRALYSSYDIIGVQAAAVDQPRINALFRTSPEGNPLGGNAPDEGVMIKGYLDTGASGMLLSKETVDGLFIDLATHDGQPVQFGDVGVAGVEYFDVTTPLYSSLAPARSVVDGELPIEDFGSDFGPYRAQANKVETPFLFPELNVFGMPALQGRVMVMDPSPLNVDFDLIDSMQTYVYPRGTPFNPAGRYVDPGVPAVDRHVRVSYGDFSRFSTVTPAGAAGPTVFPNPFIGPNPVRPPGAPDDTPGIGMTEGGTSLDGSFLFDTGAAASFLGSDVAGQLGVFYREGTYGTDDPVLVDANDVEVPNQFTIPVGGVGGTINAAGFRLDALTVPTVEGEPIRFLDVPILVVDVYLLNPLDEADFHVLDGVFGMNLLVSSYGVNGQEIGDIAPGAFDWVTFDQAAGLIGLQPVDDTGVGAPASVVSVAVNDGRVQRSRVTSLTVTFDRPVTATADAFELTRRTNGAGGGAVDVVATNPSGDGRTFVLTFAAGDEVSGGSLVDGVYDLRVVRARVNSGGVVMAADYGFKFHRLYSDADGDGDSDNADLFQFRPSYGRSAGDPAYKSEFDADGDGDVDNADLFQVRSRRGVEFKGY